MQCQQPIHKFFPFRPAALINLVAGTAEQQGRVGLADPVEVAKRRIAPLTYAVIYVRLVLVIERKPVFIKRTGENGLATEHRVELVPAGGA